MANIYDFMMTVWMTIETDSIDTLAERLRDSLESTYSLGNLEVMEEDGNATVLLQLQMSFSEDEAEDDEPNEDTMSKLEGELWEFLQDYRITHLQTLEDAATSYLLGIREE